MVDWYRGGCGWLNKPSCRECKSCWNLMKCVHMEMSRWQWPLGRICSCVWVCFECFEHFWRCEMVEPCYIYYFKVSSMEWLSFWCFQLHFKFDWCALLLSTLIHSPRFNIFTGFGQTELPWVENKIKSFTFLFFFKCIASLRWSNLKLTTNP